MAAFDAYLKIDTIEGESPDSKHPKEIQLISFNLGATNAGSFSAGGGGGAGKVQFKDATFVHHLDKASPKLFLACASGQHIPKAVLTVRKAGGEQQDYLKVTMSDLLVSGITNTGHANAADANAAAQYALPTEEFTLNFTKIEFEYKEQKPDGSLGGAVQAGWDVKANKKV